MPRSKNTTTLSPPTPTSTLTSRLHELISACFTGIWDQTQEPHEAAREITDLCRQEGWRLGIWDCDSGMQFPIEHITMPGVTDAQDPLAAVRAMPQIANGSGTTIMLFENLHRFLGSVELIQAVARQAITGKHNRAFIVVLAPVTQIPPELDKLFVCVDHELPDHAQLEEIARGVATQDGELPNPDELPRVIVSAKGLTRSEAENAYSLSLVRHGTLMAETLWEIKLANSRSPAWSRSTAALNRSTNSAAWRTSRRSVSEPCADQSRPRPATDPAAFCSSRLRGAARVSSQKPSATKRAGPRSCSMSALYLGLWSASRRATSGPR
jgi:hypothetical protein